MASFNRVILMGNLTRDVELKYTSTGMAVTEVSLAVNDRRKNASGDWIDETTFVEVTLWGRTAEICNEYLGKGSGVMIEGRLKLDRWEDKQDGSKRSKLRVVGERMQMLPKGGGGGGPSGGGSAYSRPVEESAVSHAAAPSGPAGPPPDEIPF